MRFFTADRAKRKFGALLKAADEGPIEIRKRGRRAYVLMPARFFDVYEAMRDAQEEARVLLTAETAVARCLAAADADGMKIVREANSLLRTTLDPRRRR